MALPTIDRDKLRSYIRKERGEALLVFLDRAIDLLPASKLPKLIRNYARPEWFQPDGASCGGLLDAVKRFHSASLRGEYYEAFQVNWRNCTQKSRGTQTWMAECQRLTDLCVKAARQNRRAEAREGLGLIFDLLHQIDEWKISIIFFADEGGSYEVPIDWRTVLPVWFRCLAPEATPHEYATAVHKAIKKFACGMREPMIAAARRAASKEQRAALAAQLLLEASDRTEAARAGCEHPSGYSAMPPPGATVRPSPDRNAAVGGAGTADGDLR